MSRHFPSHANQRQFDRRSFLRKASIGTVGLSGVALVGSYGLAYGDEAEFVTLWVLNSNWGTLRGPAGKERTACRGNACHRHAANKIFMNEAFANSATGQYWPNGGKLHPCCLATAEPIQVKASTLAALLEHSMDGGKSVDRRCLGVPEILKLSDPTSTTTTTSTPSTTSSSTVVPDPAPSSTAVGAAATLATTTTELPQQTAAPKPPRGNQVLGNSKSGASAAQPSAQSSNPLAFTGSGVILPLGGAALLAGAGVTVLTVARRRQLERVPEPEANSGKPSVD
jgi:hypothetical protein